VVYLYLVGGLEHIFAIQLGFSSSQLTNSIIFQRGRYTTNQYSISSGTKKRGNGKYVEIHGKSSNEMEVSMKIVYCAVGLPEGRYNPVLDR